MLTSGKYIGNYSTSPSIQTLVSVVSDFSGSYEELLSNLDLFKPHTKGKEYSEYGPLRECISVFLKIREGTTFLSKNILPETLKLIQRLQYEFLSDGDTCWEYVTILPPGKEIYLHSDTDGNYWDTINRYQFYYTGNDNVIQNVGNINYPAHPGYFYRLDHRQLHSYKNNSTEPLMILIFDIKVDK
jgi:hypothetical protein